MACAMPPLTITMEGVGDGDPIALVVAVKIGVSSWAVTWHRR